MFKPHFTDSYSLVQLEHFNRLARHLVDRAFEFALRVFQFFADMDALRAMLSGIMRAYLEKADHFGLYCIARHFISPKWLVLF